MWRNHSRGLGRRGLRKIKGVMATLLVLLASLLFGGSPEWGFATNTPGGKTFNTITIAQLPVQGRDMLALIYQGGPFRHEKDGVVFANRERILPAHPGVYYREYTVRTPGERSRGARRIVCGGLQAVMPEVCYYTEDHYASFRKIVH